MARVNVDQRALTDSRFTELGMILLGDKAGSGYGCHALGLGVMIHVWNECTERGCHALHDVTLGAIQIQLGLNCGSLGSAICIVGLGERTADEAMVRIKGTTGRVEWLEESRKSNRERQKRHRERNAVSNALVTPLSRGALTPALAPSSCSEEKTTTTSDSPSAPSDARALPKKPPESRTGQSPLVNGERRKWLEEAFVKLYEFYPRHVGKDAAWRAFLKADLDADTLRVIALDLKSRVQSGEWDTSPERVRFIPHLSSYLNQRRWTDEAN